MNLIKAIILVILISITHDLIGQHILLADSIPPDSAILKYKKILDKTSNSAYAYFGLASAYFQKGNYKAVLNYSKKNLSHENDFRAQSYLLNACAFDRLGRIDKAMHQFEKAIKIFPNDYLLHYQYAISCYKYREHEKSLKALEKAISIEPLFVPAHYLYACTLFENNNDRMCVSAFLFGLMLDNDSARAQRVIAFLDKYLKHQPELINIPFFEKRLTISTVDHILSYYFPAKKMDEVQPNNLIDEINSYLTTSQNINTATYDTFFKTLSNAGLTDVFSHFIVRTSGSPYMTIWYKANREKLKEFASFLDKNLPGK